MLERPRAPCLRARDDDDDFDDLRKLESKGKGHGQGQGREERPRRGVEEEEEEKVSVLSKMPAKKAAVVVLRMREVVELGSLRGGRNFIFCL